jgi:hypothetical protein
MFFYTYVKTVYFIHYFRRIYACAPLNYAGKEMLKMSAL